MIIFPSVRPRHPPQASAPGDGPAVSFSLYMGRSYGHPADPCASLPQAVKPAQRAARCGSCKIRLNPYQCPKYRVRSGNHRAPLCPWFAQSHLKPCPLLTFWAFRPLSPESPNSLPLASRPSYGPLPLLTGSPLTSGVRFSSYGSPAILRHPLDGA